MSRICLIRQPAGLGDILYTIKIGQSFIDMGYHVVWPVIKEYECLKDYIHVNGLEFVSEQSMFPHREVYGQDAKECIFTDDFIYLPLQRSPYVKGGENDCVMKSKYQLAGMNSDSWESYFNITRNRDRENHFYYNVLKLQDYSKYILVNKLYGSPPNPLVRNFEVNTPHEIVNMDFYHAINIFDWIKVFDNAQEVHTVDTAICYILYKLNISNVHVYMRPGWAPGNISALFSNKFDFKQ